MQREPIFIKKLYKEKAGGKLVIGIIGTHSGAGVTHLGILLANYFSQYLGLKTAFVECGFRNGFQCLQQALLGPEEDVGNQDSFSLQRITFYGNRNLQSIPEIIGGRYDCVILDLGTDMAKNKSEFLRCDKKIVAGSLAMWKLHDLERFIVNSAHIKNSEQWVYAIPFTTEKVLKEAEKRLEKKMYGIPCEPDPFLLSGEIIRLFQRML